MIENEQQEIIIWVGATMILIQLLHTGLLTDIGGVLWGTPAAKINGAVTFQNDFWLLIGEIAFIGLLYIGASDPSSFGTPTVAFLLLAGIVAVMIFKNADAFTSLLGRVSRA